MGEKLHAKFSASGSERWLNCPGSIKLSERAPPSKSNRAADEGTEAHTCFEMLLKASFKNQMGKMAKSLTRKFPEEMVDHALEAANWVLTEAKKYPGAEILSETEVPLPVSEPGQFGTTDAAIVELYGVLTVIDFKYGAGIAVSPEENSQLVYYALGIAASYDFNFEKVRLVIIQPRAVEDEARGVKTYDMSIQDLKNWLEIFEDGIQVAKSDNPELNAGDWCRFCPAKVLCPEISTNSLKQAQTDFDDETGEVVMPDKKSLSVEKLSKILHAAPKIRLWLEEAETVAATMLERGETVPGFKLVAKRSTRKWTEPPEKLDKKAMKLFGPLAFTEPELLSPAQLEKIDDPNAKEFVSKHSSSLSSGTTLVPETDKRPAVTSANDFEVISHEMIPVQTEKATKTKKSK